MIISDSLFALAIALAGEILGENFFYTSPASYIMEASSMTIQRCLQQ
jgi:hypothetical protein